jgi:tetratricopeptide (TPR) repeat protein
VGSVYAVSEFRARGGVESALKVGGSLKIGPNVSTTEVQNAVDGLRAALRSRPDDAEAIQQLAVLLGSQYRLQVYHELVRDYPEPQLTDQLWSLASPVYLHRRVGELSRANNTAELAALRERSAIVRNLEPAYAQLLLARSACPLFPETHVDLAEIGAAVSTEGAEQEELDLKRARKLAPANANVLYRTGLLDLDAQRVDLACQSWRRSLDLSQQHLSDILRVARQLLPPQRLVDDVLPPQAPLLITIARVQLGDPALAAERELEIATAEKLLKTSTLPNDELHYWRGALLFLQGDRPAATAEYQQAVKLRPGDVSWRYELALLYFQQGMLDKAHEQAQICARSAPDMPEVRALLKQIHEARSTRSP